MKRYMPALFLVFSGLIGVPVGHAQENATDWNCAAGMCTENAVREFARVSGTFRHAARLDTASNVDRVASLEQQSLREFEFAINEPALIFAELSVEDTRPSDWPEDLAVLPVKSLLMWRSDDGKNFASLAQGGAVGPGDTLLIGVPQRVEGFGTPRVSYFPGSFNVTLRAKRRRPVDVTDAADVPLPPLLIQADTDGVDDSEDPVADLLQVTGEPNSTPAAAPGPDGETARDNSVTEGANGLARELQRELARVGCYAASIDGLWGPASRRAMTDFNSAAQQDLEVQSPTARALAAIARTDGRVCGAE